jgi:hypothetical protein
MTRAVRLAVAIAIAAPAVLASAPPCAACTCPFASAAVVVDQADVAFAGVVVSDWGAAGGTIQRVRVRAVYEGEVGPRADVFAAIGSGVVEDCAVLLPRGVRVAVVADRRPDGTLVTGTCQLMREAVLRRVSGPPHAPDPAIRLPTPVATAAEARRPTWALVLAVVAVLLLLALVAVAMVRRREPVEPPEASEPSKPSEPAPADGPG